MVSRSALRHGLGTPSGTDLARLESAKNFGKQGLGTVSRSKYPLTREIRIGPILHHSTAPTSKIPNAHGPQDDRTGKTTPGPLPSRWPRGPVARSFRPVTVFWSFGLLVPGPLVPRFSVSVPLPQIQNPKSKNPKSTGGLGHPWDGFGTALGHPMGRLKSSMFVGLGTVVRPIYPPATRKEIHASPPQSRRPAREHF